MSRDSNGFPPGPPRHPVLGNLPDFARNLMEFFTLCAREHGDVVGVRLGTRRAVVVSHPDLIERVLVGERRNFVKHRFFWRHVTRLFGEGLLAAEGDVWRTQRKLIAPAFHQDRLDAYAGTIAAFAERHVEGWRDGETRNVRRDMTELTLQIIAKLMFDVDLAEEVESISRAVDGGVEEVVRRLRRPFFIPDWVPIPSNRRYLAAIAAVERVTYDLIERRRGSLEGRSDLLSTMMRATDDGGRAMTRGQLRDEVVTMLLAGHETTAIALAWTLDLVARHAEVQSALAAEADAVLGGRSAGAGDLGRLPTAEAVVNEAMRLYPPVYAIGREPLADWQANGFRIPAGTTVYMSQWVVHRDPRFFEDPAAFRPERWRDGAADRLPRFAYFPFGGGPRICVGQRLAMMEAILILATLARRVRFEPVTDSPPAPKPALTLRPATDVPVRIAFR